MRTFCGALLQTLLLGALAACGRSPKAPPNAAEVSPPPAPALISTPAFSPSAKLRDAPARDENPVDHARTVRAAVVIVSVFDKTGHLSGNGHGFFVSDDGRLIADRSVTAGGVNAVAKAADGAIYNISGELAQAPGANLVLLKADVKRVPFLTPSAQALPDSGGRVEVILSPAARATPFLLEEKLTAHFNDSAGEWFDVAPALPKTSIGAPVINDRAELVGIVVLRNAATGACAIRPVNAANGLLAQTASNMTASWQVAMSSSSPTPAISPTATKAPSPPKISPRGSRLVYAPPPRYPATLKHSHWSVRGSGSYRILFDAQGNAANVQVVRSTGSQALDDAALTGLQNWRAQPGNDWSIVVPITFEP